MAGKKNKKSLQFAVDRSIYERADADHSVLKTKPGLTRQTVEQISQQKNEPDWMLDRRLKAFDFLKQSQLPVWGPSLAGLDLHKIVYFARPEAEEKQNWKDLPSDIQNTFNRLGIPQAEKELLAGVGAQYDSDVVYHNLKKQWEDKGVIFENMDVAVQKYPELVKKYFMTGCVPLNAHYFASLHGAVWSGGTFIYVPKGVEVDLPLQAYFRMNVRYGGQFEHTLIIADEGSKVHYIEGCSAPRYNASSLHAGCVEIFVGKNAKVKYSSIENWSKNTYNLNTKRAIVEENGVIEWINGNMGSGTTMLYPTSILKGRKAHSDSLGIAFAGAGQHQDTGSRVIHAAPETTSTIRAKSISAAGGLSFYRGEVVITAAAAGSVSHVNCDGLMLDDKSTSATHPIFNLQTDKVTVAHEAKVGRIGEDELFYLMSRGLSEQEAIRAAVSGFIEPIVKALPLEYALELNKLIELEVENSII